MSTKPAGEEGRPWDEERGIPQDSAPCKDRGLFSQVRLISHVKGTQPEVLEC